MLLRAKSHFSFGVGTVAPDALPSLAARLGYTSVLLADAGTLAGQVAFHAGAREAGMTALSGVELEVGPGFARDGAPIPHGERLLVVAEGEPGYRQVCRWVSGRSGGISGRSGAIGRHSRAIDGRSAARVEDGSSREDPRIPLSKRETEAAGPRADLHGSKHPPAAHETPPRDLPGARRASGIVAGLDALPEGVPGVVVLLAGSARLLAGLLEHTRGPGARLSRQQLRALITRPGRDAREEAHLVGLARREGIPLVADLDVTVGDPEDRGLQRLMGTLVGRAAAGECRWPVEAGVAALLFGDLPEAVEGARRLTHACAWRMKPRRAAFPTPSLPPGVGPDTHLASLLAAALAEGRAAGSFAAGAYDVRLDRELAVVRALGLAPYFVMVADIAALARRMDVPVVARGSAAASLALRLLGVSRVDPVASDLLFERFLNRHREDVPDVDLDVCSRRRDAFLEALAAHFGPGHVARIAAYPTVGRRRAIGDAVAALGAGAEDVRGVRERLPPPDVLVELDEDEWQESLLRALRGTSVERHAPLLLAAVGLPTHRSTHAGGLVLAADRVEEHAPLERAPKGVVVTQYDKRALSWLGLVKVDVLGSRALTQIRGTLDRLDGERRSRVATELARVEESLDPDTLARLHSGDTIGCSQLETPPVRAVLSGLPLRTLEDLAAALAVVRPGPASGEAREEFLRRARGASPRTPRHPALGPTSSSRYGLLLYEEDVLRGIARAADVSLEDADRVRVYLLRHAGDEERLRRLEERFLRRAARSGRERSAARALWREIERFAAYSFNQAHAASYARVAYEGAYLRTHEPLAFACAVLDDYGGAYPLRTVAAAFVRSGSRLRPPHVRESDVASRVAWSEGGEEARLGLARLRGLTRTTTSALLEARATRPFADLGDLLSRVPVRRPELETLVLSGALDDLAPLRASDYPRPHEALLRHVSDGMPAAAFRWPGAVHEPSRPRARYQALVRARNELRTMEMHPSAHPLAILRPDARASGAVTVAEAATHPPGQPLRLVGLLAASRRVSVGPGARLHLLSLEDESGIVEAELHPRVARRFERVLTTPGPYLLVAHRLDGPGAARLRVHRLEPFHRRRRRKAEHR